MRLYSGLAHLFEQKLFPTDVFARARAGVGAMALALALSGAATGALAEQPAAKPAPAAPVAPAAPAAKTASPAPTATAPAAPTAAGFWQSNYEPGKPSGWFYFVEHNGFYEGRLVKGFKKTPDETVSDTCANCPGDKKNAPMMGLVIVWGMQRHGAKYENGSIMDPRDGSIYHAQMEVSPDGQKLFVRGYLGVSLFGQTQTWDRLPDNVIPANAIPGEPVVAAQAKKKPSVPAKPSTSAGKASAAPELEAAPAPK
jgi:uncharacterized protein (DUF2147 family)